MGAAVAPAPKPPEFEWIEDIGGPTTLDDGEGVVLVAIFAEEPEEPKPA